MYKNKMSLRSPYLSGGKKTKTNQTIPNPKPKYPSQIKNQ